MLKPIIQDGNEVREMNAKELAQYEVDAAAAHVAKESLAEKDSRRISVVAKFVKLGFTADEIATF